MQYCMLVDLSAIKEKFLLKGHETKKKKKLILVSSKFLGLHGF